jgi:hypothetical protein
MSRTCTVCRHAERSTIDADLITGAPRRELARRYGLSATSVGRHADAHLTERLAQAAEAAQVDAHGLLDRVQTLVADLEHMLAEAKAGRDFHGFLRVVRELRPAIELLGRATGELTTGSVTVNVAIEQQLGVSLEMAQKAVGLYQSVEGMDRKALIAEAEKLVRAEGATVLWPPGLQASTS